MLLKLLFQIFNKMEQIIFLSVILTFFSCFINNEEVLAFQSLDEGPSTVSFIPETASILSFPYMTSLRVFGSFYCVANIIGEDDLVAPAHCFTHTNNVIWPYTYVTAHTGTSYSQEIGKLHQIAKVTVHPGWTGTEAKVHDIAHIKLTDKIGFNRYRQKVNIPAQDAGNLRGWVTGWGFISPYVQPGSDHLRRIQMWTRKYTECQRLMRSYLQLHQEQFCVYHQSRYGRLKPGSGAPIVSNNNIIGIQSWSVDANCPNGEAEIYVNIFAERDFLLPLMQTN